MMKRKPVPQTWVGVRSELMEIEQRLIEYCDAFGIEPEAYFRAVAREELSDALRSCATQCDECGGTMRFHGSGTYICLECEHEQPS